MLTTSEMKREDITKPRIREPQAKKYGKLHNVNVNITTFQFSQIQALCRAGLAKNPTDFTRQAILEMIRQNKHLLPPKFLPPALRGRYKKRQKNIVRE